MSIFQRNWILSQAKEVLKKYVYRPGKTYTILAGPLRGYKYRVTEDAGWSPLYGGWEATSQQVYAGLIKPSFVVYDLGANVGVHALLFAKLAGPQGKVFAFEPLPQNMAAIEDFKQLNGVGNVEVVGVAASNAQGTAEFLVGKHNTQGSLVGIGCETGNTVAVKVERLDDLIKQGLPQPDFIKIDIEGAEADALEGFDERIAKSWPVFAIDLHTPEQDVRVGAFFKKHGYRLYRVKNHDAERINRQQSLLSKIEDLDLGWPNPAGVWGVIVALHPTRQNLLSPALLQ
jgi:FkbM family methyltransferase